MVDFPPPQIEAYYVEGRKADLNCVISRANKHSVPANVLIAVWEQEAGSHGKVTVHPNGAIDVGEMQFNRRTIKSDYASLGITEHHLKSDGCYAADLAAQRLATNIAQHQKRMGYWRAVARYHSANEPFNTKYANQIRIRAANWERILTRHFATKYGKNIKLTMVRN